MKKSEKLRLLARITRAEADEFDSPKDSGLLADLFDEAAAQYDEGADWTPLAGSVWAMCSRLHLGKGDWRKLKEELEGADV
jgi:hypothetical protein